MGPAAERRSDSRVMPMIDVDRRAFLALASVGLLELAAGCSARLGNRRAPLAEWLRGVDEASTDLRSGHISPSEWQSATEAILGNIDHRTLLHELHFDEIVTDLVLPDLGVTTRRLHSLETAFPGNHFIAKIFGVQRGRAIIPHGHRNMVSAHTVLSGEFALRQFDKIAEDDHSMVIRQTVDEAAPVGSVSSISDEKDNVHWFVATTERAYTFDLIVVDLAGLAWEVHNIDPLAGEPVGNTDLRVPKLDVATALQKYGNSNWDFPAG